MSRHRCYSQLSGYRCTKRAGHIGRHENDCDGPNGYAWEGHGPRVLPHDSATLTRIGEWVRAEEAEAESDMLRSLLQTAHDDTTLLRAVVDALPKCKCGATATTVSSGRDCAALVNFTCTDCADEVDLVFGARLPYADALRALGGK